MLYQFDDRQGIGDLFEDWYERLQIILALDLRSNIQVQFVFGRDDLFNQDLDHCADSFSVRSKYSLGFRFSLLLVCSYIGFFDRQNPRCFLGIVQQRPQHTQYQFLGNWPCQFFDTLIC